MILLILFPLFFLFISRLFTSYPFRIKGYGDMGTGNGKGEKYVEIRVISQLKVQNF